MVLPAGIVTSFWVEVVPPQVQEWLAVILAVVWLSLGMVKRDK